MPPVTPAQAVAIFHALGGDCPCYADMLTKAQSLARKRRLSEMDSEGDGTSRVVAKRIAILADKSGAFSPKTMEGDSKLKLFQDFLNAVSIRPAFFQSLQNNRQTRYI